MQRTAIHTTTSGETSIRPLRRPERSRALAWLDHGLRGGRPGRLASEYGAVLEESDATHHFVATQAGRFVAHALARRVVVRAGGVRIPIGLIGLVYTEPAHRRRGLAAGCIRACEAWLAGEGAGLAVLWSDRHAWYERLGYHLAGVERMHPLDATVCERAGRALPFHGAVGAPRAEDWPALEGLHRKQAARAERRAGFLASLASGPDCQLVVARGDSRPVAYAALGRGDDFPGVVHEWAGEPGAVLACLSRLREGHEAIECMTGPGDDPLAAALSVAGAPGRRGGFGLAHLIEPAPFWRQLTAKDPELADTHLERHGAGFRLLGEAGARNLDGHAAVRFLLDPGGLDAARGALSESQLRALSGRLPWPLFIWGFDSV